MGIGHSWRFRHETDDQEVEGDEDPQPGRAERLLPTASIVCFFSQAKVPNGVAASRHL